MRDSVKCLRGEARIATRSPEGGSLSSCRLSHSIRTRKAKWPLSALCLPLLSLCALTGQERPIVSAEERASSAPPGTVTPAPDLLSIPQPNLSGVEGSVRVQIEAAWAELQ